MTTSRTQGFSTVEMLIAMAILVLMLSTVILVSFGNQSVLVDSQTSEEALNKAQEMLEREQALAREDFNLVNPTSAVAGIYTIHFYATSTDLFTKSVEALVTWQTDHNRSQHVSLDGIITNFDNAVGGDTCSSILTGDWTRPKAVASTTLGSILGDATGVYTITDLDAYQKKLYVTVNNSGTTPNTGAKLPNTSSQDTSSGASWSSINSIQSSSDSGASAKATLSGTNLNTKYLEATNLNLNIPKGATILGIQTIVVRNRSGSGNIQDSHMQLIKPDGTFTSGTSGDKAVTGTNWSTVTGSSATYGNTSDLWGGKWTSSDIDSSAFGVAFSAKGTSGSVANVDYISVTVTYVKQFYVLDISSPSNPTFLSTNAIASSPLVSPLTVGFNAVAVATSSSNAIAYIATGSGANQFQEIDLSGSSPVATSTLALSASAGTGKSIVYKSGYVYLGLTHSGTGPEFNIIAVSTSTPQLVGYASTIGNDVNGMYIQDHYAYVVTPNVTNIKVYDVSQTNVKANMSSVGSGFTPSGTGNGKSLYGVGRTLYLGRTIGPSNNGFSIVDASTTSLGLLGTSPGTNVPSINSILTRGFLTFTLNTNGQFQIWRTDNPSAVTRYDTTNVNLWSGQISPTYTPMDCEANSIYAASNDPSGNGHITVITSQ